MTTTIDADQGLRRDLAGLERKRRRLEQIVDITRAIESMQASLHAVLAMGVAAKDLPEEALQLYGSLSGGMCDQPINKIRECHGNLELIVGKQLNRILGYSGIDFSSDDQVGFITLSSKSDAQSPVGLLNAFKRTAQTAVSLRVLLRKRGIPMPGSALPASSEVLKRHLSHLNQQERLQRGRIRTEIEEMKDDILSMIDNSDYADAMRAMLRDAAGNLERDLQLLERGAPVGRLSFVAETQEIQLSDREMMAAGGEVIGVKEILLEEAVGADATAPGMSRGTT